MKLKICGMKYPDNIKTVSALQPNYMGFIFYDKSPRYFEGEIPEIPKTIKKTGVFVNARLDDIIEKVKKYKLKAVQLHGDESAEYCIKLKKNLSILRRQESIEIIKVFSIKDNFDFSVLESFDDVCNFYLFDTKGKLPGGNGYSFNWSVLKNYPSKKPYFLSGGIGLEEVENVLSFLQKTESQHCYAIDINSKFEIGPGLKNIEKLKTFINKL